MRILHLVHQYPPRFVGGTEIYTQSLATELARRGHHVAVFHRRSEVGRRVQREPGPVREYGLVADPVTPVERFRATFGAPFIEQAFRDVLTQETPDLVHIQHLMSLPVRLVATLWQRQIPYGITLHDYWYVCANAQLITDYARTICTGPRGWVNCSRCALARLGHPRLIPAIPVLMALFATRGRWLREVLQRAAFLIAPTRFVRDIYVQWRVPEDKIQVIGHGIILPQALPVRQASPPRVRFAYIGGLTWQKGVHVLIEAFNGLDTNAELVIAGDPQTFPEYSAGLRAQARHPGITFVGALDRAAVWNLLAQTEVLVVPSLWYETASLVIQEAFAAGVPVVASHIGALAERVRDGVDGMLFAPGDATALRETLQRLAQDGSWRAQLKSHIRPAETIQTHVDQIETLYKSVARM